MRGLLNSVVILFILATLALAAFFVHQRQKASYRGESYSFFQAPVDLGDEIRNFFSSNHPEESAVPAPPAATNGTGQDAGTSAVVSDSSVDQWQQGRKCYLAGNFEQALALFRKARNRPSGQQDPVEAKARLFQALLGDDPVGSALKGPPQALITLPGGDPFYAEVVSETDEAITFKRADGVGARVEKSALRDLSVARTPEQKRELAEREYQRRHAALATAADYLQLGRFCQANDLCDHLTYVMERGMEAPGDAYQVALFEEYKHFRSTTGGSSDAERVLALLKEFYRGGEYTRTAVLDSLPGGSSGRPGIGEVPAGATAGKAPPSGIGASDYSMPRSTDPKVNALLAKADRVRREADQHYAKAAPGMPERGTHRDKGIKLYEEAIGMYEEIEERWGVSLDAVFKDMLTKRYALLKDKPIR